MWRRFNRNRGEDFSFPLPPCGVDKVGSLPWPAPLLVNRVRPSRMSFAFIAHILLAKAARIFLCKKCALVVSSTHLAGNQRFRVGWALTPKRYQTLRCLMELSWWVRLAGWELLLDPFLPRSASSVSGIVTVVVVWLIGTMANVGQKEHTFINTCSY